MTVCKKVSTFVPKIADVFSQLMQSEDTTEVKGLETCLMSLFHIDAQGMGTDKGFVTRFILVKRN